MIDYFIINNFKSIKSKKFDLKNLNVLLGLNGQGKSSFIQTLLLLRQSKENLKKGVVNLNGDLIKIGTAKDALYQFATEDMSFVLCLDKLWYNMEFDYESDSDILRIKDHDSENEDNNLINSEFPYESINEGLFNESFQYLNADRIEPKSLHKKSLSTISLENNIGTKGEYTVHYLEVNGDSKIAFDNCLHPKTLTTTTSTNESFRDKRILHQVNLWLSEISPEVNVITNNISSEFVQLKYEFNQPTMGKTMAFNPENVGFGISYALHVVTALLSVKPNGLLIIENPESHIHPRGQAELGKLISLVAQNNVQIIIETHSDHILNGIRVGVKEAHELKDKVSLFYFNKVFGDQEQYSQISDIRIDENGTLSDEPDGLLDEWGNQLMKLL